MVDPGILATNVLQAGEADLGEDGAELARGGRDTVTRGPVARREDFSWNDEGRGVGAEVLEEVGEAVEEDECALVVLEDGIVPEAHDNKDYGEKDETHELDGLASPDVDQEERGPVPRDQAGDGKTERQVGQYEGEPKKTRQART